MNNKYTVFLNDSKKKIVEGYGKVKLKNKALPTVAVYVKTLETNEREIYDILLPNLAKIKIGSVFKNQQQTGTQSIGSDDCLYQERIEVDFDFSEHDPENIVFTEDIDAKWDIKNEYLYDNDTINTVNSKFNTVFAKLVSKDGTTFYLPSLELLVSGYKANARTLINYLCMFPLNVAIEYFSKMYVILNKDTFFNKVRKNNHPQDMVCTNYLANHPVTKRRASIIWTSIALTEKDATGGYIAVLPYQPEKVTMTVSGFWIDNKRFFVQEINKISPPSGSKTIPKKDIKD